ncbi:macro domain-containing protein [Endozoicomonas lisbonensis]
MNPLSGTKTRPRLQTIKEWLKKSFKGWFKDKPVRVLSSHVGRSLKSTPDWSSPPDIRERDTSHHDPLIASSPPALKRQKTRPSAKNTASLQQLASEIASEAFKVKMKGYSDQNLPLMKQMNQLKTLVDSRDWLSVETFIEQSLETQGIQNFSIYRRRYRAIANTTPYMPQPGSSTLPTGTKLKHRNASPTPVAKPSAALSVLSFRNGQVNLFSGDITRINHKVHPGIDTIVCPHRSEQRRTTPTLETLADREPALNQRGLLDQLQTLESGHSMITAAGKVSELGFKQIVHTILPEQWDSQPTARLFNAYVSAIREAHNQGSVSIAIPILSRYMNLPVNSEAQIAHMAIQYYLNHPDTKPEPPRIYLVFPENAIGEQLRVEHQQLNMDTPASQARLRPTTHSPLIIKRQLEQALDGILPVKDGMPIAARMQWLTEEVDRLIELIKDGQDPGKDSDRLIDYLDTAEDNLDANSLHLSSDELALARKFINDLNDKLRPYYNQPLASEPSSA